MKKKSKKSEKKFPSNYRKERRTVAAKHRVQAHENRRKRTAPRTVAARSSYRPAGRAARCAQLSRHRVSDPSRRATGDTTQTKTPSSMRSRSLSLDDDDGSGLINRARLVGARTTDLHARIAVARRAYYVRRVPATEIGSRKINHTAPRSSGR